MDTDKLQAFVAKLHAEQAARIRRDYSNLDAEYEARVTVKPGSKYTRVDVGTSGKYMVENATGNIYGIKGYGVVHRGYCFGTLDTINEWNWSEYRAFRIGNRKVYKLGNGNTITVTVC